MKEIEFRANKARLTTKGPSLDDVASIDDVRCIEDVGEVVTYNDEARRILLDSQPSTGPQAYQGEEQLFAVVDSGLDREETLSVHKAFESHVRWSPVHGSTEDFTGHGAHVCGAVVGDGTTSTGLRLMGTAPQAKLIMQSIWDPDLIKPGLNPPSDLTMLFENPN